MPKKTLKLAVKPAVTALEIVDDAALGAELTCLYHEANDGFRRVLRFGAAFLQIEQTVTAVTLKREGLGMKPWLEKNAPEVGRSTAYKYRDITEAVALKFKIADAALCFADEVAKLSPMELGKRERALDYVAGKSLAGVQMELGLVAVKSKPVPSTSPAADTSKMSAKEKHEAFIVAARKRALDAFSTLHDLENRWQLLDDNLLRVAIKDSETFVKLAKAWVETAPIMRVAFDPEKFLNPTEEV